MGSNNGTAFAVVAALVVAACGAADTPEVAASATTPAAVASSEPVVPTTAASATRAAEVRDCADIPPAPPDGRFTEQELEESAAEAQLLFGAAEDGDPFVYAVGTSSARGLAEITGVGDRDVLAARIAEVVTHLDRVCLDAEPFPDTAEAATWTLATAPQPDDTTLSLVVEERACSGGDTAEGRIRVEVAVTDDEVRLDVSVVPKPGAHTCPGNPGTPHVVSLDEPIGDRLVVDATSGRPPAVKPQGPGS